MWNVVVWVCSRSAVDQIQERLEGIRRNAFTLPHYFPPISARGEAAAAEEGARVAGRGEEGAVGGSPRTAGGVRVGESATRWDRMGEEVGANSSTIASTVLGFASFFTQLHWPCKDFIQPVHLLLARSPD